MVVVVAREDSLVEVADSHEPSSGNVLFLCVRT